MSEYQRSTTRSRREEPRFSHYSKWLVVDDEGNYTVHFKTKVLTQAEARAKLMRRKWYRKLLLAGVS